MARPGHEAAYSHTLELDLSTVEPSIAGPKRPHGPQPLRIAPHAVAALLSRAHRRPKRSARRTGRGLPAESFPASDPVAARPRRDRPGDAPPHRAAATGGTTGRRSRCRSRSTGHRPTSTMGTS